MTNAYYNHTSGVPAAITRGVSTSMRAEFDLVQAGFALLPSLAQLYGGTANYCVDSGTANAYILAAYAGIVAYSDGLSVTFKVGNTNTTSSTINLNSIGAASVIRTDGTALQAGDLTAGTFVTVIYNTTLSEWQIAPNASVYSASASASSSSASSSASTATTQAGISTAQAVISTAQAVLSTASAATAAGYASSITSYVTKRFDIERAIRSTRQLKFA
jgi:hypothetical protein